jgi:hypothetical protein
LPTIYLFREDRYHQDWRALMGVDRSALWNTASLTMAQSHLSMQKWLRYEGWDRKFKVLSKKFKKYAKDGTY